MAIKAEPVEKKERKLIPEGNHAARVYRIIELGHCPTEFQGVPDTKHVMRLGFEFPNETADFGDGEEKPFVLDKEFTISMFEKANLRKVVEAALGTTLKDEEADSFDITDIMGKTLMIDVRHKESKSGNIYANMKAFSSLPKGMAVPDAVNPPFLMQWDDEEKIWDKKFQDLPQFIQDRIKESKEWKEKHGEDSDAIDADDIPF